MNPGSVTCLWKVWSLQYLYMASSELRKAADKADGQTLKHIFVLNLF